MHIGGIWSEESQPDTEGWEYCGGGLRLHYDRFVTVLQDERHLFAMEGQIFDAGVAQVLADPARLETAYGHYAYVRFDKPAGEVSIGTDRFGYYPLYYAFEDGRFIFGSSLGFVKNHLRQRTPDFEAWEEILTLGEVIGDKSTVKQIKRLSEGTRIQIKDRRVQCVRYWRPEVPDQVDEATYIRDNNNLLDEAMALTASQAMPKVVLLSGGEDSRRIALAAVRQGLEVSFFTQETSYKRDRSNYVDADLKLAVRLSELLGRPHFSEPIASIDQYFEDWKARDVQLGFECIAHEWLLPLVRRLTARSLVYDGIVGDVTINGHYLKSFPPEALENHKNIDALARMICGSQDSALVQELRLRSETSLWDRVRQSLSSYPESPQRLNLFSIFNHNRRKIACASQLFGLYGHATCYPYLYYPLFLQSLGLDPKLQVTKHYQRECMEVLSPKIVSIPTTRQLPIPEEWLIARDDLVTKQENFLMRNLTISNEALEVFPNFRGRYRALDAYRKLTDGPLRDSFGWPLRRLGWFIPSIARYSAFLNWLESDAEYDPLSSSTLLGHGQLN